MQGGPRAPYTVHSRRPPHLTKAARRRPQALSSLALAGCSRLGPAAFGALPALAATLASLDLSHSEGLSDDAAARLARACTALHTLALARCPLVGSTAAWHLGPVVQARPLRRP
jgi:hypothetical protein